MASLVVNQGLQRIGINASGLTGSTGVTGTFAGSLTLTRYIMSMSVDDAAGITGGHTNFQAADTTLRNAGSAGPTNEFDANLDAVGTRTNQAVAHTMTIPTGSGNFTIVRIALHDDTAANVTTTSTTLVAGVDGQSLAKTSDFTLAITLSLAYTSV